MKLFYGKLGGWYVPMEAKSHKQKNYLIISIVCLAVVIFCLLSAVAMAADVTLAWDANTESDLAGYKLYWGTVSGVYPNSINVGNVTQYKIPGIQANVKYYYAATAYDLQGNESEYSNELEHTVDTSPPAPPTGLKALLLQIIAWFKSHWG